MYKTKNRLSTTSAPAMFGRGLLLLVVYVSVDWAAEGALLQRGSSSRCSLGFIRYKSSCYLFSHSTASYAEALSFCRDFGSRLAQVNSKDEYDFIKGQFRRKGNGYSYYIGGTDQRVEGIWTWENPVRRISYFNWDHGQPSNAGGKEHCLDLKAAYGYRMNDDPCDVKNRFVCEQNL